MDKPKEDEGKRLLRQAWEYGQRVERQARACKHTLDLFGTELQALRKKLREKCSQTIILGTSHVSKAEELLWKKSVYDIVQRCKANKEALDGSSPLFLSYRNHLESCMAYYCMLLERLEEQYGLGPDELSHITIADLKKKKIEWLKDLYYQCFVHLGDLARYQITVGGSHFTAVAYYHHAIALDPSRGASYNQLAALAGSKNEQLDAVYYYQRSITSAQPFQGSLSNLTRIYEKNQKKLESLESVLEVTTEQNITEFTRDLLLVRFVRLQQMLQPNEGSISGVSNEKVLGKLCNDIIANLEECLVHDLTLQKDTAPQTVTAVVRGDDQTVDRIEQTYCLPHDLLLKICALAILSSHSLRSLGSTFTPAATTFALSLFSQLLDYSHKRLSLLLNCVLSLSPSASDEVGKLEQFIEEGTSMVDILLKYKVDVSQLSTVPIAGAGAPSSSTTPGSKDTSLAPLSKQSKSDPRQKKEVTKEKKKTDKKRLRMVNRRRRRRRNESDSSSEDCESLSSDNESSTASDDSLSMLTETFGEDDLEMLDRLSDSSSSGDENSLKDKDTTLTPPERSPQKTTALNLLNAGSPSKKGKRQIVLAASFNLAPSPKSEAKVDTSTEQVVAHVEPKTDQDVPTLEILKNSSGATDIGLKELIEKTDHQSVFHTVCCLAAEESYLMPLRVFMEWLQSYPIAVAACSQSSSTIWSRLAALLNFLPTEDQIDCLDGDEKLFALLEDVALRGFSPLLTFQDSLTYKSSLELVKTKQATLRMNFCQTFGHFIADVRTVPSFSWDRMIGKFIGPAQKQKLDEKRTRENQLELEKQAQVQRSKLMNAMAQQKLQHEVASLEVTAKKQEVLFTPYLVPDAVSLCTGLHIVKKLLATEKFIFVIAKSVIETLDNMKKGRDNFTSREVIKFLEKEFKEGNKFIKAQKTEETLTSNARKPSKMDIDVWRMSCLIDCAVYYNQTFSDRGQDKAVVTVLVDQKLLKTMVSPEQSSQGELVRTVQGAWQNGLDVESMISFYSTWQRKAKDRENRK